MDKEDLTSFYKGKRILLTGDTGFKGSWLAIWLNHLGAEVLGIALPPINSNDNYNICGVASKIKHKDIDIRNLDRVKSVVNEFCPEIVFHLAAQALVLEGYKEPVDTFNTNIMGTVNLLESVRHSDSVKSIVIVTTDKCYQNKEWIYGYRENDRLGGHDPYSTSKAACEIVTAGYIKSFFSNDDSAWIATARAGNVIGGGDWAENRIIPDCIRALKNNKPVEIRNPAAVRPWQHVLEPLSGYITLAKSLYENGEKFSGAWNFGPSSDNMINVRTLAEKIIIRFGRGGLNIQQKKNALHESGLLHLDISKAVNKLNWKPKLDFSETVNWTVDEYNIDQDSAYDQRIAHIDKYMDL